MFLAPFGALSTEEVKNENTQEVYMCMPIKLWFKLKAWKGKCPIKKNKKGVIW